MITVFCRTLIIYLLLIGAMRLMGKRQVGELQISELVITLMLSELAVTPIADKGIPIAHAIVPILTLLSVEVVLSFWMTKSEKLKEALCGRPSMLIRRGKLDQKELLRVRMGISELMSELRLQNIADISDVDYAILEENGRLSVFLRADRLPLSAGDAGIEGSESSYAHLIIGDGKIHVDTLRKTGHDENWLKKELRARSLTPEDVFLMTMKDSGKIEILLKEKGEKA